MLVTGSARAPRVLDRGVLELSDASVPASRQPYHAVMYARSADRSSLERRLCGLVQRVTRRSLARLLAGYRVEGHAVQSVALVVGSLIDPARIGNDHIRAHALEGQLFRTALEGAVRRARLPCTAHLERALLEHAATRLRRPRTQLKRLVTELGRAVSRPWRADEKTATLAAWVELGRRH